MRTKHPTDEKEEKVIKGSVIMVTSFWKSNKTKYTFDPRIYFFMKTNE